MSEPHYPVTDRSRVRLFGGRGSNRKQDVYEVIDRSLYGVIAYAIDGQAFATPTMVWRDGDYLYWHGSAGSRMLKHVALGEPVSINFTHLDGFVLSRLASAHTLNYRSVMVFGRAEKIESLDERLAQLRRFLDTRFPGRWDEVKQPTLAELNSIIMVRMKIEEASLKRRAGPPADGAAVFGGEALYEQACWAGEIPLATVALPGKAAKRLKASVDTPAYVTDFARNTGLATPAQVNMPDTAMLAIVQEREALANDVIRIRLAARAGARFPRIAAGAHARVAVVLKDDTRDFRPYTVVDVDAEGRWFDIAVLKEPDGQGGSLFIHERTAVGDTLAVEAFANEFPLDPGTQSAVLIAGGIGVTPIVAMARELEQRGVPFTVHYSARGVDTAAYRTELARLAGAGYRFYDTAATGRMPLADVLGAPAPGKHVYTCGPAALVDAVCDAAQAQGYGPDAVHQELFKAPPPRSTDQPVAVRLAKFGAQLDVAPGTSILDAVLAKGVPVPHSCKRGECGECAVRVLDGKVSHRDHFLDQAQRDGGLACICVSWAESGSLALDL